jgi:2-alkyl-3-oxoalkanoate reductase
VIAEMERTVLEAEGLEGVVLRYGWFYGPGTHFGQGGGSIAEDVRRRRFPIVGRDDPAPMRDWLPVYADAIGAKPPRRVPAWLAWIFVGRAAVTLDVQPGASNERVKRALGWAPRWPSWREGFREAPR